MSLESGPDKSVACSWYPLSAFICAWTLASYLMFVKLCFLLTVWVPKIHCRHNLWPISFELCSQWDDTLNMVCSIPYAALEVVLEHNPHPKRHRGPVAGNRATIWLNCELLFHFRSPFQYRPLNIISVIEFLYFNSLSLVRVALMPNLRQIQRQ